MSDLLPAGPQRRLYDSPCAGISIFGAHLKTQRGTYEQSPKILPRGPHHLASPTLNFDLQRRRAIFYMSRLKTMCTNVQNVLGFALTQSKESKNRMEILRHLSLIPVRHLSVPYHDKTYFICSLYKIGRKLSRKQVMIVKHERSAQSIAIKIPIE